MPLKVAFLEITQRCNLSCKHCYLGGKKTEELTTAQIFKMIDTLVEWGIKRVVLFGGEPTLRNDFYEILQYSIDNFELVTVETNGTTHSKFNSYNCAVSISFEYPDEEYNDEIRGEGVFDKTLKKLQAIKNPKILRYTIYNDSDPLAMAMIAERVDANSVGVPLKPVGSGVDLRDKIPSGKIMVDFIKDIVLFNSKTKNRHLIEDCQWYIVDPNEHKHVPVFIERGRICSAGVYRIYIDVFGNVYPCMFLPHVRLGNILKDNKTKIFKNLKGWCDKINNIAPGGKCANCEYYNVCNGGCVALYDKKGIKLGIGCGIELS